MLDMKRRDFIATGGSAALLLAVEVGRARAQQPAMPVVGFLRSATLADAAHRVTAFRQGLKEAGFVEGQNVAIEYRSAENQIDRLPALVANLLRRQVAVIVGEHPFGARGQGRNHDGADRLCDRGRPGQGWPRRQPQPAGRQRHRCQLHLGGTWGEALGAACVSCVPGADDALPCSSIPRFPTTERFVSEVRAAASAIGQQLIVLDVSSDREIETAFATLVQRGAGALLVGTGAFLLSQRERIVALAARHRIPGDLCLARGRRWPAA